MVSRLYAQQMLMSLLIIFFLIFCFHIQHKMPHISIHTLHLKVLDIIIDCLSNWSNPKLNITIELQETEHASMVFIHVKHKSSSTCFFKSAIRISTHRPRIC